MGSRLLSSKSFSVELDNFIAPKDCEELLDNAIRQIRQRGVCAMAFKNKELTSHTVSASSIQTPFNRRLSLATSKRLRDAAADHRYQELERLNQFLGKFFG